MKPNQRVMIVSLPKDRKAYPEDMIGCYGVIYHSPYNEDSRIGVKVEGHHNKMSRDGVYWLRCCNVICIDEENKEDNNMLKGFSKVAAVTFQSANISNPTVTQVALYDDGTTYEVGDTVLVAYKGTERIGTLLSVVADSEMSFDNLQNINSEIICKIDRSAYKARVDKRARAAELMSSMDKIIKEMDEVKKYEVYAKDNEQLAQMLAELKSINS